MAFLAYFFQFLYLFAHTFVVTAQEFAYGDYNIYLVRTISDSQRSLCDFNFDEGLGRGKSARYASDIDTVHFQRILDDSGKLG